MAITYKLYKNSEYSDTPNSVIKKEDGKVVLQAPFDPANTDYQEIQKWIAENLKKYKDKSPYEFNEAFKKQYPNKNLTDYLSIKK